MTNDKDVGLQESYVDMQTMLYESDRHMYENGWHENQAGLSIISPQGRSRICLDLEPNHAFFAF